MRDSLLRDILREYQVVRQMEEQALRDREAEVFDRIPEIARVRHAMISLLAEHSRARILSPGETIKGAALEEQIPALKDKEKSLLRANGYSVDYLEHHYRCSLCHDTGYTGELVREKCKCLVQRLIDQTYGLSDIHELKTQNFDTFDSSVFSDAPLNEAGLTQRDYMQKVKAELLAYQDAFPDNTRRNILFCGQTGLGKTFLLNCLAKGILDKGCTVMKTTSYNLFEQLFRLSFQSDQEALGLRDRIFHADVLIIDDLGTETKRNNYTAEALFNILNERSLHSRHTILSTNLKLTDLKDWYSERVTSRLFDTRQTLLIRFLGQDIRLRSSS